MNLFFGRFLLFGPTVRAAAVVHAAAACCSKLLLFQHRDRLIMGVFRILLAKTLISIRLLTVKCKATGVS